MPETAVELLRGRDLYFGLISLFFSEKSTFSNKGYTTSEIWLLLSILFVFIERYKISHEDDSFLGYSIV
jgi:hypothetical protein